MPATLLSVLLLSSSVIVALEAVYSDDHDPATLEQIRKAKAGINIALNGLAVLAHVVYQATRDRRHVECWKIACEWLGLFGYLLFTIPTAVCALSPTSDCHWAWFICSIVGWLIACVVIIILMCAGNMAPQQAAAAAMPGQPPAPPGGAAAVNAIGVVIDVLQSPRRNAAGAREVEAVPLMPARQSGAAATDDEGSCGSNSVDFDLDNSCPGEASGAAGPRHAPGGVPPSNLKKTRKHKGGARG